MFEWNIPSDVRRKCLACLRKEFGDVLDRLLVMHALLSLERFGNGHWAKNIFSGINLRKAMYDLLHKELPSHVWYDEEKDVVTLQDPLEKKIQCNLCIDLDWDEAIYCPKCFGEGMYVDTSGENIVKLDVESIIVSDDIRQGD